MECKYETGELSGVECPCDKCKAIREALEEEEVYVIGP